MQKVIITGKFVDALNEDKTIGYMITRDTSTITYTVIVSPEKLQELDIEDKDIVEYLDLTTIKAFKVSHNGTPSVVRFCNYITTEEDMGIIYSSDRKTISIHGYIFDVNDLIPIDSDFAIKRMFSRLEY